MRVFKGILFKLRIEICGRVRLSVGRKYFVEGIGIVRTLKQDGMWNIRGPKKDPQGRCLLSPEEVRADD